MEEKRFIKCDGRVPFVKTIRTTRLGSTVHYYYTNYEKFEIMVDVDSIKEIQYVPDDKETTSDEDDSHVFIIPRGWYIESKHADFRIADEEVEVLLKSKRRNAASAIDHLTAELSYSPGIAIQGSEYLQAMDRQRDHFSEGKK